MNKIFTLLMIVIAIPITIVAQINQVSVGQGYSQQAYYNLETDEVEVVANEAWDVAFTAFGQHDAGVFINESATFMTSPQLAFVTTVSDWTESITDTDMFADSLALYNLDENWTEGAFNTVKDDASPFDYGWGVYNPQSNTVEGDKIFIIKKRDGSFIKFQVVSLAGDMYTIRYADLNGDNEQVHEISKQDAINGMLHFSLETNKLVDMPSDYDLIFQRYSTTLDAGDGSFIPYTVTGVVLAPTTEAVTIDGVDPSDIDINLYLEDLTPSPLEIGHDWKSFDFSSGWIIDTDRTHLVKNANGTLYKITFFDFEGSSTGITTLEKTVVGTVSSIDIKSDSPLLKIFPNPTKEYFSITLDDEHNHHVAILDANAKVIKSLTIKSNERIDVGDLASGIYYIHLMSSSSSVKVSPLIIK